MSEQPTLFRLPVPPPPPERIRLYCGDVADLLAELDEPADLCVADPPWLYTQAVGKPPPYPGLSMTTIRRHLSLAYGSRLALWVTWPKLGELTDMPLEGWGRPVTGGVWVKSEAEDSGHYGQGYHWAGCSEPVLLYSAGQGHTDRTVPLRNAWVEAPSLHSRKPVEWQAQWIRRWVPDGGLVLDLYAGLGSVAEAVLLAGGERRYLGAEVDPERHTAALALLAGRR